MPRVNSIARFLCRLGVSLAIIAFAFADLGHALQGGALTVHLGQSRMIQVDQPIDSVVVADPATADVQVVSSQVLFVLGKAVGRTSLALLGNGGELLERWKVAVALDVEPIRSALAEDAELRDVQVRERGQGAELVGVVASTEAVDRALELAKSVLPEKAVVLNRISVASAQQVNLEVQIAEVRRTVSESLGINWEAIRSGRDGRLGFRVGRVVSDAFAGTILPEGPASALFGGSSGKSGSVRGLIDALASAGLATVLARPNMTAVSGQTASFFSGGEYPLPTGFEDGRLIFTYKKYGVLLDFVPTVIDSRRIALTVRPEVSQRAGEDSIKIFDIEIPAIDVRRAETTIEVGNGESIVIAGLYRNQGDSTEAGVPGLKDLPSLGLLFGKRSSRSSATELIIAVTARLVGATGPPADESPKRASGQRVQGYHY